MIIPLMLVILCLRAIPSTFAKLMQVGRKQMGLMKLEDLECLVYLRKFVKIKATFVWVG